MTAVASNPNSVGTFLRADAASLHDWIIRRQAGLVAFCFAAIIVGAGLYGAAVGS